MGIIRDYFETQKKETRGGLNRILVVADDKPASEALVLFLESYFTKDDMQEMHVGNRFPHINILDTADPGVNHFKNREFKRMHYSKFNFDDCTWNWTGLTFENGKIKQIHLDDLSNITRETILESFKPDSRSEASSILTSKLVSAYIKRDNYDVVLFPDTATKIASKVLTLTSQGRGYALPWECASLVKMPNGTILV
jgi:hypothetical protein